MRKLLTTYLKDIAATLKRGDAREESYYGILEDLFKDFPLEKGRSTDVTTLPKKTDAGNPDFRVWDGDQFIVGYIEAKTPGTNLDQVETSEQLERYLGTFPNVILTDFFEFRLYRDGVMIGRVTIGHYFTARQLKSTPTLENAEAFEILLEKFFAFKLPQSFTAEKLAVELAKRTRFLRDQVVAEELRDESSGGGGDLSGFYQAFKKYLIAGLTTEQFADLYSQTITYGLFAARTRADGNFNRKLAFDLIPPTIGILRDVFRFISLGDLSPQMAVIVEDITAVLNAADINSILDQYYKEGKGEDPIIHFYETFLNVYDPETRERRGVYYTPEPVVKYIVRSVHQLLKDKFGLRDGLADPKVTLLDPAAGTMTFPAEAIKLAVGEYVSKYGEGGKKGFIRDQILKNYYAFELMMAPYAIGHMKISILLESLGYTMGPDDRFQLYLTNTLEMEEIDQISIPGLQSLSEESKLAGKVKKEEPILVIMGNPPYSGMSANKNEWTEELLKTDINGSQSYYKVDDKPLDEKNPKWLQDDYVKFLRFAQWKMEKAGKGIVAMITNHSYLDNPTFRGMRQSLMKTFDEIYILDLHGNSLKRETTPDGGSDENVFDIRQGVAISLFIKTREKINLNISHNNLFGTRNDKYEWLQTNYFDSAYYKKIDANQPFYFFVPRSTSSIRYYLEWPQINKIFPANVTGIVTARDNFVIDIDKEKLKRRIELFRDLSLSDEMIREIYDLNDTRGWNLTKARKKLAEDQNWDNYFQKILYRPFDIRNIYYTPIIIERGRHDVMQNLIKGDNLSLCFMRQFSGNMPYTHVLVTENIVDNRTFFSSKGIIQQAPLYLFPDKEQGNLFLREKTANISNRILSTIEDFYSQTIIPENFLSYIYAICFSNIFREKYDEFLRIDFPRVPFTKNIEIFKEVSKIGKRLIDLHLLRNSELKQTSAKFKGQGEDLVIDKRLYDEENKRVYINQNFYFEGIAPEVWEYQVGGYQVLDKYLKDRKGQRMDDPRHFIHIATALEKTIEIQTEIDAIYPEVEKDVIEF